MRVRRWFRRDAVLRIGVPLGIYLLTAVFMTWPLVTQISTHIIGPDVGITDNIEHIRMIWWVDYAIGHGLNPFYQSLFGYPDGFFSTVQWAQPLVYWPPALLGFIVNPVAAANLWMLAILVLNGLAAYWLCLDVLRAAALPEVVSAMAAVLGGLIFMAFPALQGHLQNGQLNIVSNFGLPILMLALYRIVNGRGTFRVALLGALGLSLLLLSNYTGLFYLVLPLLLFGGGYWVLAHFHQMMALGWRLIGQLIVVFGGAALLCLPFYLPLIQDAANPGNTAYLATQSAGWVLFSTDPMSFFALSPFTPWTRTIAPSFSQTILAANSTEGTAYLGVIALLLALVAIIRLRQWIGVWLAITMGAMLFSLGPMLKWNEQAIVYTLGLEKSNIVLPWALFQSLPLIRLTRTPGRFNIITGLGLGVLAALGLSYLLVRVPRSALRVAICCVLVVGVVAEYQLRFPIPTFANSQTAYLQALAQRSDVRAVFDVPYDNTSHQSILEQIQHQKPIIAGYYSRDTPVDPSKLTMLAEVASGRAWQVNAASDGFPGTPIQPDTARSILKDNGIDVLIYHKAELTTSSTLDWATGAFGQPAYQDDQIAAFEVPTPKQHSDDLALTHAGEYWWPFSAFESGWWPDGQTEQQTGQGDQNGALWLKNGAQLVMYSPVALIRHFTMSLTPAFTARHLSAVLDGHGFDSWAVQQPSSQIDFWLSLSLGFHQLQMNVDEGCTYIPITPTCLVNSRSQPVNGPACTLPGPSVCISMQVNKLHIANPGMTLREANISLDQGLSLRGFRLPDRVNTGGVLPVEMDWVASQPMGDDYHLFMHVFDKTGKLIAQYDSIPNNGKFPTTQWATTQTWNTVVPLRLSKEASTGTAEVYAGWYRYPDLLRLPVHGDSKGAQDGQVFLGTVEIHSAVMDHTF